MKILIIGSKGFIGSHCHNYFSEQNHEVFGCDVVVDYTAKNYFLVDATNANYQEIFARQSFEVCINCSGAANVQDSITNPQRDFQLNVVNVFSLLNAIRLHNPKCKFINISSAAVYGHPQVLPVKENQFLNPISPYGFHKKYAEEICSQFYSQFQIQTCSIRIFSAYGPGLKKQLMYDLFQKIKSPHKVELFGTGNETRDFIYIDDLVIAIDKVINYANYKGESINVASGTEHTIQYIAKVFAGVLNAKTNIIFNQKTKPGDPTNWLADIEILTSFGFKPIVPIEKGIKLYISWAQKAIQ